MVRPLDASKARELVEIVQALGAVASFRNIMREAARRSVLARHETLRRYLDLLVWGKVLKVRTRDVGSVNRQQLYTVNSKTPKVLVGPEALRLHGLNWDVPENELRLVSTDFEGLARSKMIDTTTVASLEDCLVHELREDSTKDTGAIQFVIAMISTRRLHLPYLLWRADKMRVGRSMRLLFDRVLQITSSTETETPASVFMALRSQFLKIARQYSQAGFWKLVDERGVGELGLRIVKDLTEHEVIMTAGKQLGVTG